MKTRIDRFKELIPGLRKKHVVSESEVDDGAMIDIMQSAFNVCQDIERRRREQKDKESQDFLTMRWNQTKDEIDFNPNWITLMKNDIEDIFTMGEATRSPDLQQLEFGKLYKSFTDGGKKIIVIGTRLGPVLIHQHLRSNTDIRIEYHPQLEQTGLMNPLPVVFDKDQLVTLLGDPAHRYFPASEPVAVENIGQRIEKIHQLLIKKEN